VRNSRPVERQITIKMLSNKYCLPPIKPLNTHLLRFFPATFKGILYGFAAEIISLNKIK
jgi:hypothetical protein